MHESHRAVFLPVSAGPQRCISGRIRTVITFGVLAVTLMAATHAPAVERIVGAGEAYATIGRGVTRVFDDTASERGIVIDARNVLVVGPGLPREMSVEENLAVSSHGFIDAAAHYYRLIVSSPAVDRGMANGGVPDLDRDGLPRTAGAAIDLGAFEFQP